MNEARPLVGIDLGSSSVSVVVGEMEEERLVVRGCGVARHDGARKGVIANLEEVAEAVHVAAEEAEAMASVPVEVAHVGIGGTPIQGVPSTASVPVTGRDHTVTEDDLQRALAACGPRMICSGRWPPAHRSPFQTIFESSISFPAASPSMASPEWITRWGCLERVSMPPPTCCMPTGLTPKRWRNRLTTPRWL